MLLKIYRCLANGKWHLAFPFPFPFSVPLPISQFGRTSLFPLFAGADPLMAKTIDLRQTWDWLTSKGNLIICDNYKQATNLSRNVLCVLCVCRVPCVFGLSAHLSTWRMNNCKCQQWPTFVVVLVAVALVPVAPCIPHLIYNSHTHTPGPGPSDNLDK